MKKLPLLTLLAVVILLPGSAFAQAAPCSGLTITGHPEYPPIGYRDGERIVGAGATVVERIATELKIPVQSKYTGSWAEAQTAARDGKVDIIFGIYFNDERAAYLEYVRPAFLIDPVVVMVAKGKAFPFRGRQDLIGKKGVTNAGESYGSEFDSFIAQKLTVARSNGQDQAFKDLLSGKADQLVIGLYPGLAGAAKAGVKNQVEALKTAAAEGGDVHRLLEEIAMSLTGQGVRSQGQCHARGRKRQHDNPRCEQDVGCRSE